jgi:hypothetical protein
MSNGFVSPVLYVILRGNRGNAALCRVRRLVACYSAMHCSCSFYEVFRPYKVIIRYVGMLLYSILLDNYSKVLLKLC